MRDILCRSSCRLAARLACVLAWSVFLLSWEHSAHAQQAVQGFALERLYTSAPGAGWIVMDTLDMHGGLGGALSLTSGYASQPLRVTTPGSGSLAVVSDEAFVDIGGALTYDRLRLYFNMSSPLAVEGQSGVRGGYQFSAPAVTLGSHPDTLADPRVGFDARLLGEPSGPIRMGLGAQLYFPVGARADYLGDGAYRGMFRLLFAGDLGALTYAAQAGLHTRGLDDAPIPGSPQGSELLFGAALGGQWKLTSLPMRLVVGPELFGESALRALFKQETTGVEALLSSRLESTGVGATKAQWRLKAGLGAGLDANFGSPVWRALVAIETFTNPP